MKLWTKCIEHLLRTKTSFIEAYVLRWIAEVLLREDCGSLELLSIRSAFEHYAHTSAERRQDPSPSHWLGNVV